LTPQTYTDTQCCLLTRLSQDLGNTNYSILIPKDSFSRRPNALLVARALQSLSVPAEVNERNDITLDGFKISGSAYKLNNRRAYHHGTMLISARLAELGHSLRSERVSRPVLAQPCWRGSCAHSKVSFCSSGLVNGPQEFTTNKGTASVPSPVQNITTHHPHVDHSSFVDAVVKEFITTYGDGAKGVRDISEPTLLPGEEKDQVVKEASELKVGSRAGRPYFFPLHPH
jgi:lipoate-protein ligase A